VRPRGYGRLAMIVVGSPRHRALFQLSRIGGLGRAGAGPVRALETVFMLPALYA